MAYWSCARLEPNRTRLALHFLELAGYPVYCPHVHVPRRSNPEPLFLNYAFVTIEAQWYAAARSPGVAGLIMHDDRPAQVPDRVITELRGRENGEGLIVLPPAPRLQAGDRVRVLHGPMQGRLGLFASLKPRQRVEILLGFFGSQRRVELARRDIMPAKPDGT